MNLAEFHLIRPYWLLALIPTIALFILLSRNKLSRGNWSTVCDADLLPFILQETAVKHSRFALFSGMFSALLIIVSLAGPTWERIPAPVFRNDAALVIALDLSRSMDASDLKPSRLSMAKYKITDILSQRKDGQTALLVYASDAYTVTPLTNDSETIISQLTALTTEIMPAQGSNTALALKSSTDLLKQAGLQSGDILLITDAVDFDDSIAQVEALTESGYRLLVLGVGTAEGAPIKTTQGGFLKDIRGNIVLPKLDSRELSRLASAGQGIYKTLQTDNSDIDAILNQIENPQVDKEGSTTTNDLLIDQWHEKGPWLLLLALPLVALQFRKGLLSLAIFCLLPFPQPSYAIEWNDLWATGNQQAQQAFNQNNYQQAADQFNNPQWKAAAQYKAKKYEEAAETLKNETSASGQYNLGNALAQSGKLEDAIDAYDKSLKIDPSNKDAQHNKEQVTKALEEQKKQEQEKEGDDKKDSDKNDQDKSDKDKSDKSDKSNEESESSESENKDEQEKDAEKKSSEDKSKHEQDDDKKEEEAQQQQKSEDKQDNEDDAEEQKAQQAETEEYSESEQANEQWLKRIPDDPAGLLKRKFKYQYGQRDHRNPNDQDW
ncbi:MAG: VWA domain-containing protein [Methylococcales bacterium]|nr:VWA domain-containing protein [Methylococcales bacterium]